MTLIPRPVAAMVQFAVSPLGLASLDVCTDGSVHSGVTAPRPRLRPEQTVLRGERRLELQFAPKIPHEQRLCVGYTPPSPG